MKQLTLKRVYGLAAALLLLCSTALTAQAAINDDTLNERISAYLEDGKTLAQASTLLAESLTQDAVTGLATPLTQESLEELIFNIAAQCRSLQDSGLLGSDMLFEDVFTGISAITTSITELELDTAGIRTAAENGWGIPQEPEAFEEAGQGQFGKMQRTRVMTRTLGDLNPTSGI